MPKITVMSAEKAFLSAHYGGPFNKEDYIIVSITDTRYEADCPVIFRPVKNLKYVFRVPFIDIAASKLDPRKTVEEQTGLDLPVFSKTEARRIKSIGDFAKKYDYHILVHCEAGVSRSQAVGACLELYVNHDASNVERLNYFEDGDVKTVFERMTKLIDIYQAIDKTKWKNVFIYRDNVTLYTGWNEIKLYPLENDVQVKHYYKYSLKQTKTYPLDGFIKIEILP